MHVVCFLFFSSVHMEESSVMQGAQGVLVQNWPTASSAAGKNQSCNSHLQQSELFFKLSTVKKKKKLHKLRGLLGTHGPSLVLKV